MIKANELRIGNWVIMAHENVPEKVNIKILQFIVHANAINDNHPFDPIPLTHDILEKAGFEMDASHQCPLWKNIKGFEFWDEYGTGAYSYRFMNNFDVEMKYVHQLQNLYFCLCGEELEIKL